MQKLPFQNPFWSINSKINGKILWKKSPHVYERASLVNLGKQSKSRASERVDGKCEENKIHTWINLKNVVKSGIIKQKIKPKIWIVRSGKNKRAERLWKQRHSICRQRTSRKGRQIIDFLLCTIEARLRILHKSLRHVTGASDCRRSTTSYVVGLTRVLVLGVVFGIHRRDVIASGPVVRIHIEMIWEKRERTTQKYFIIVI